MNPALRVTLLGTGPSQGVPAVGGPDGLGNWGECDPAEPRNRRGRTSALLESANGGILLVDAGPDCRAQLMAAQVKRLDGVLITHAHADHIAGLDELRAINRSMADVIQLYAAEATLSELTSRFAYAFLPPTRIFFRPALAGQPVSPGSQVMLAGMPAELLDMDHGVMRSLGLRIGRFAYTTDVIRMPAESLARLHGLDTWVISCMQPGDQNPVHAGLQQVLAWWREVRPRRTVLTHLGDRMDYARISAQLPEGVELGFDGMRLDVPE
ncbi:MBL fold metallo-hydrolase [Sediminicoccus sp. KRV36]|uniref:MBL fold metallo-hydrolase n=1 Tax=Sediminicoccus sp. KRV36 TaxID=3133721 RepID=UPI00200C2647|nr:MBL fold metallo-hydrolase [Sediminicoccus rosea]UPY35018.1 MBL fold metallo-hydrolase [Sediminicoccus rosea]